MSRRMVVGLKLTKICIAKSAVSTTNKLRETLSRVEKNSDINTL